MEEKKIRGRFAPSPSGRMHLGNVWSGLLAWLSARSRGGEMVLRLEDLDPDRCTRVWCDQVMRDLEWLGLTWDNEPVYQSERTQVYAEAFHALEERGLIYPCYCTRAERLAASAPHRSDGQIIYDGRCARLTAEEREALSQTRRPAWRVKVGEESIAFCDLLQGEYKEDLKTDCGEVVRGSDLLSSTPRQIYLQRLLGLPQPEYGHVPLLLSADGRRLAKRDRDQELGELQSRYTAPELIGRLAHLAGLIPEPAPVTPEELIPLFSWEKLQREDVKVEKF